MAQERTPSADAILGTCLGDALGDALGNPMELMNRAAIEAREQRAAG